MPRLRYDEFIYSLKNMQEEYPEFAELLQWLIEEISQTKIEILREKLTSIREEKDL
ncbi:MAG TPA: hypothetical protein V6D12_03270 [Candidatus Obscuribacterales bacterium]